MITYLKHTGHSFSKSVSFNPEFETVVETGLDAKGNQSEKGEYVRVSGWNGLVSHVDSKWHGSMDITCYTVFAYNPTTKKMVSVAGWSDQCWQDSVSIPQYDIDLADEWKKELLNASIEAQKDKIRRDFHSYGSEIRKFIPVVVARGRKVPVGTKGYLFWEKNRQYGLQYGLKQADGTAVFVSASNCDRDPESIPNWTDECEEVIQNEVTGNSRGYNIDYDFLAKKLVNDFEEDMIKVNSSHHKITVENWKNSKK